MRIIHNFNPGSPWTNMFKCGDNPVGSFISGMFGLAGTESTNETNEDIADYQLAVQIAENQKNRDYNTAEAEKARNFEAQQAQIGREFTTSEREAQQQWQQSQWEYQQKNQLPLQMQGARNAGVNPNIAAAKMMSAQGGSVSAPTGASSPMPGSPVASYSGGLSPIPYQAVNPAIAFAQAAQGLASLATAKEKGANVSLIEKQVENMAVDTQYKQVLTDGFKLTQALSKIDLKYHEKKIVQDLAEQIARTTSLNNAASLSAATTKIQDSIKRLNEALLGKHTQEATLLALEVGSFDKRLSQQLKLQGAQIREANAKAFEASENAKTTQTIRSDIARYHKAVANIEDTKDFVSSNTAWNDVQQSLWQLRTAKLIPEQLEVAIERAKKDNNWYEVKVLLGMVDQGIKAYGAYKGATTGQGFVNAQDVRNQIDKDFREWQMQQGNNKPGPTYDARQGWLR